MFDSPIFHVNAPHAASHLVFFPSVCLSIAVQFEALRRRSSHFRETAKHVEFNGSHSAICRLSEIFRDIMYFEHGKR